MTAPSIDDPGTLRQLLATAEALFLDFDGPVCSVFAGLSASTVVDQLCVVLADGGYGDPPPEIEKSSDPFDVLRYAATLGEREAEYVNAAFAAHEVEAITAAEPTSGAHELMRAWSQTGNPLAIVSNNSAVAVEAYLDLHHLQTYVRFVSARTSHDPSLLKPSPYLLGKALDELNTQAAVFVGDSVTDVEAAHAAGVAIVGYANRNGKVDRLVKAGPEAIVTNLAVLISSVR